jgi:RNA polymerase sigma-70 factor, ECF subfamily
MDELEIIREIKAGDTNSYARLVERYHRPLLAFIFNIVGDKDLVEDIGQEVFFTVYKSLKKFDEKKGVPFSAWLFTMARNRCISILRQRQTQNRIDLNEVDLLEDGSRNPEENMLAREQMIAVVASLEKIPEPFRTTILLSLEGNSLEEIVVSQNIAMGTVKSRLFRAKKRMRLLISTFFECKENLT